MPQFVYTVKNQEGVASSGMMEAADREAASRTLVSQGLIVTRLSPVKKSVGPSRGDLTLEQQLSFTQSVAAMLEAGMTLGRALNVLSVDAEGTALKRILVRLDAKLSEGQTFSSALREFPRSFSRLYVSMIEAGEASGRLPEIMGRLSRYIEESAELQGKVRAALMYPALVLIFAALLVLGLLVFAVPRLNDVYQGLGAPLPFATRVFVAAGNWMCAWWMVWVPLLVVALVALERFTHTRAWDGIKLKAPVIGPLFRRVGIARFARTLGSLYVSGVPIAQALDIVAKSMENQVLEDAVLEVSNNVVKGETLASQMRETHVFTQMAVGMISAGEESGALERMLERLASYYETQVAIALKSAVGMIEPLMMMGVGVVVGGIVLVIALPFLQIATVLS